MCQGCCTEIELGADILSEPGSFVNGGETDARSAGAGLALKAPVRNEERMAGKARS